MTQCYTAALPFLKYTVAGDLFWAAVLFGGAWLVQRLTARRRARRAAPRTLKTCAAYTRPKAAQRAPASDAALPRSCAARLRLGELQADRDHAVVGHRMRHAASTGPSGIDVVWVAAGA